PASTASKAPASTAGKAPAKTEASKAVQKTASKSKPTTGADGEKKKRKKSSKETYSSYIYKGNHFSFFSRSQSRLTRLFRLVL
ncbi:hypothetical protein FB446DRAFT_760995, partial [Lentinula raphanica]